MSDSKVFTSKDGDGKELQLRFVKPSQKVVSRGDFVYREHFGKSVRAGLMTNAEAEKLLKDRNIWGEAQEEEAVDLQTRINTLEDKISELDSEKVNDGMEIYRQLKTLRTDLDALGNIRRSIVDNTAEAVAAEMRTQFYASECVVYNSNGQKVFRNLEDLTSKLNEQLALDAYKTALIANYESVFGIDLSKINENDSRDAEDKWFDSIKNTDDEEKADEAESDEAAIEEEAPKEVAPVKKKRPRKKKAVASVE